MKLITNNKTYDDIVFYPSADGCYVTAAAPIEPGDTLTLQSDDGVTLREYTIADYLRCVVYGNTLRLTSTPEAEPAEPDLDALKTSKIAETKNALEAYLAENSLLWTDGKYYSVTDAKTTLLMKAITTYQMKVAAGVEAVLKWNDTGEQCTEWTLVDLTRLALAIDAFVAPLVSHQQALEVAIRAAATADELESVVINYEIGN